MDQVVWCQIIPYALEANHPHFPPSAPLALFLSLRRSHRTDENDSRGCNAAFILTSSCCWLSSNNLFRCTIHHEKPHHTIGSATAVYVSYMCELFLTWTVDLTYAHTYTIAATLADENQVQIKRNIKLYCKDELKPNSMSCEN